MPQQTGYETAVQLAAEKLQEVNLPERCHLLGLPQPQDGILKIRAFGDNLEVRLPDYHVYSAHTKQVIDVFDQVLVLHYLLCDLAIEPGGDLISFRELQGGKFFWKPFNARTSLPLVKKIGNNLELLKRNLQRVDWECLTLGDLGARIHAIGKIFLTLVYRQGDDEFPPSADILFDPCITRVYNAEDATVLSSRICRKLL